MFNLQMKRGDNKNKKKPNPHEENKQKKVFYVLRALRGT